MKEVISDSEPTSETAITSEEIQASLPHKNGSVKVQKSSNHVYGLSNHLSEVRYDKPNDDRPLKPKSASPSWKRYGTMLQICDIEDIFDVTSHYGWYQFFMLVVIQYTMINAAGNYVFISFATLKPACGESLEVDDACAIISLCPANSSERFFHSLYEESFVCPNSKLPHHLQTIQAIGSGIGAIIAGHFADYYGRKWVTYSGMLQMIVFGIIGSQATNWWMLAIAMLGMGFSYGVYADASMTLACETAGSKYRIIQNLAFQWSLALQVNSICAYLTGSWRKYLLVINLIPVPVLVLILFWVESPRWLIQKKRYDEAAQNINRISKWNGSKLIIKKEDLLKIKVGEEKGTSCLSIMSLVSSRKLANYSLAMFLSALTVEICVSVIIFDVQILAGNPFLNVALYGILRMWVPFFIIILEKHTDWFGRRTLFIFSQSTTLLCFIALLILSFLPQEEHIKIMKTCFALLGGIVNSSVFFTVYKQYVMELYPTVIRALAVGTFGVVERIGGGIGPQLVNMNRSVWPAASVTITTSLLLMSLTAGCIILPETRNQSMPDVLEKDNDKHESTKI